MFYIFHTVQIETDSRILFIIYSLQYTMFRGTYCEWITTAYSRRFGYVPFSHYIRSFYCILWKIRLCDFFFFLTKLEMGSISDVVADGNRMGNRWRRRHPPLSYRHTRHHLAWQLRYFQQVSNFTDRPGNRIEHLKNSLEFVMKLTRIWFWYFFFFLFKFNEI